MLFPMIINGRTDDTFIVCIFCIALKEYDEYVNVTFWYQQNSSIEYEEFNVKKENLSKFKNEISKYIKKREIVDFNKLRSKFADE